MISVILSSTESFMGACLPAFMRLPCTYSNLPTSVPNSIAAFVVSSRYTFERGGLIKYLSTTLTKRQVDDEDAG